MTGNQTGRLATSRPLGERGKPFLAAKRPTASDEVARGPSPYEIRRRTFLKVYQTGSIWAKNVVIYNDDRRVELGTPDLAITIPWPCLISLQTTKWNQSREPAHTTDKLLRLSAKGNTCPSWLSAREVYARSSLGRFLVSIFCDLQITLIITIWNMSLAKVDLVESLLPQERLTICR